MVFTNTIGDPGRGERIAAAVLDDDEARAEIAAPVVSAVVTAAGLPDTSEPVVAGVVDELLRDPQGARSFVEPFAGSWARLLGEPDPRPGVFDLGPIAADIEQRLAAVGVTTPVGLGALAIPEVPLPERQLGWMDGTRDVIDDAILPLALNAVGLALIAFVLGNKRKVTRKVGYWAIGAGALWIVVPWLLVAGARAFAPGADAVIAASLDAATSGMRATAASLMIAGGVLVAGSVLIPSRTDADADDTRAARTARRTRAGRTEQARGRSGGRAPATEPQRASSHTPPYGADQPIIGPAPQRGRPSDFGTAPATTTLPATAGSGTPTAAARGVPADAWVDGRVPGGPAAATTARPEPDSQSLWNFYAESADTAPTAAPPSSGPAPAPAPARAPSPPSGRGSDDRAWRRPEAGDDASPTR